MSMREDIAKEIDDILSRNLKSPNEATTCSWIIEPLIAISGYQRWDYVKQTSDNVRSFPDYTFLPDTKYIWYLEAKGWNNDLQDSHAYQALNYANQNGAKIVVLTNGREWRIYDNSIQGDSSQKLIVQINLENSEKTLDFFEAIGKSSMQSGGINEYVTRNRLGKLLPQLLMNPNSYICSAILRILKKRSEFADIKNQDIAEYFKAILLPACSLVTINHGKAKPQVQTPVNQNTSSYTLHELNQNPEKSTRAKPLRLILPDDSSYMVGKWVEVSVKLVEWVAEISAIKTPFQGRPRGNNYFINTTPSHKDGKPMIAYKEILVGARLIYIDTNRSAKNKVCCLYDLCVECDIDPSDIKLEIRGSVTH